MLCNQVQDGNGRPREKKASCARMRFAGLLAFRHAASMRRKFGSVNACSFYYAGVKHSGESFRALFTSGETRQQIQRSGGNSGLAKNGKLSRLLSFLEDG